MHILPAENHNIYIVLFLFEKLYFTCKYSVYNNSKNPYDLNSFFIKKKLTREILLKMSKIETFHRRDFWKYLRYTIGEDCMPYLTIVNTKCTWLGKSTKVIVLCL